MRIISGTHKGRIIRPPKSFNARPTTDLAKESLFNILINKINLEDIKVLDVFSGTGSISYEFASRGSKLIMSVEKNPRYAEFIKKSCNDLRFSQIKVIKSDVFKFLKGIKDSFDLIFADPPYDSSRFYEIPELVFKNNLLNIGGLLIIEHPREINFVEFEHFSELRKYGKVNFSFFEYLGNKNM